MDKLKLEAGKYYKTRGGKRAFLAGVSPFECTNRHLHHAVGFIDGEDGHRSWDEEGVYERGRELPVDLVAVWREPVIARKWIALFERVHGDVFFCGGFDGAEQARRFQGDSHRMVALKEVEITEGEGM